MATLRERHYRVTLIKLSVFAITMLLIFAGLVVVFSQFQSGSTKEYSAIFMSASRMKTGSKVKIAGVEVGTVKSVELTSDNTARVEFSVDEQFRLLTNVRALIRYENLTGDRYLELQQGAGDLGSVLKARGQLPITQTEPALELDKLLGGFKPLLRTLKPTEVNELTASLIKVFQGEGENLSNLLKSTASFTDSIADRDELIGEVITNLNSTLGTLNSNSGGFNSSIDRLQQLISGLSAQRTTVGNAITNAAQVTNDLSSLLVGSRKNIHAVTVNAGKSFAEINKGEDYLRTLLPRLPGDYKQLSNLGSYGGWLQLFICRVDILLTGPAGQNIVVRAVDLKTKGVQNNNGRCVDKQ